MTIRKRLKPTRQTKGMSVESFDGSYIGRRKNNEDYVGKCEPSDLTLRDERGCLYLIADGMGGHAAGEVASRLAVETVLSEYYASAASPQKSLMSAIKKAHQRVRRAADEKFEFQGMGSTIVACLIVGAQAIIAHVGDSRAYRLRDGDLSLLTRDHLHLIEDLGFDKQSIEHHPLKHKLSRALGINLEVDVDMSVSSAQPGDCFLLCSDGLTDAIPETAMRDALREASPRAVIARLLQLAREYESDDNSTALAILIR